MCSNSAAIIFKNFKTAVYCSALVMKLFNNSIKLIYVKIITVKLLLLNALLPICQLTFITEALCFVRSRYYLMQGVFPPRKEFSGPSDMGEMKFYELSCQILLVWFKESKSWMSSQMGGSIDGN